MERKIFSIKKAHILASEGLYDPARIVGVKELEDITVKTNEGEITTNLLELTFDTLESTVKQRYFESIDEGSSLDEVIKAVNNDEISNEIEDLENFLVGKKICIRLIHNKSTKTGRTFANPVEYYPVGTFDEVPDEEIEITAEQFDAEWESNANYKLSC